MGGSPLRALRHKSKQTDVCVPVSRGDRGAALPRGPSKPSRPGAGPGSGRGVWLRERLRLESEAVEGVASGVHDASSSPTSVRSSLRVSSSLSFSVLTCSLEAFIKRVLGGAGSGR